MRSRRELVLLCAALAACRASPPPPEPASTPTPGPQPAPLVSPPTALAPLALAPAPRGAELPGDWAHLPWRRFGAALDELFPAGEVASFSAPALAELGGALAQDGEIALRAVLLLARAPDAQAGEWLLARLERRGGAHVELGCAVDLAAAAALAGCADARAVGPRLESLSFGRRPHPDLEVRVECARTALALGREKPIPFLLSILRAGTPLGGPESGWKPIPDMASCQRRAAEALCQRAGLPCRYQPLAALETRVAELRALEAALLGASRR